MNEIENEAVAEKICIFGKSRSSQYILKIMKFLEFEKTKIPFFSGLFYFSRASRRLRRFFISNDLQSLRFTDGGELLRRFFLHEISQLGAKRRKYSKAPLWGGDNRVAVRYEQAYINQPGLSGSVDDRPPSTTLFLHSQHPHGKQVDLPLSPRRSSWTLPMLTPVDLACSPIFSPFVSLIKIPHELTNHVTCVIFRIFASLSFFRCSSRRKLVFLATLKIILFPRLNLTPWKFFFISMWLFLFCATITFKIAGRVIG